MPLAVPSNAPIPTSKCHFSDAQIVIIRPETIRIADRITAFITPILSIKALPKGAIIASTTNINARGLAYIGDFPSMMLSYGEEYD